MLATLLLPPGFLTSVMAWSLYETGKKFDNRGRKMGEKWQLGAKKS